MFDGGAVEIDDANHRFWLHRRSKIEQERIGLGNLVIHMNENSGIEYARRQSRIVFFTEPDFDVAKLGLQDTLLSRCQKPGVISSAITSPCGPTARASIIV
jgi:hypothetical protein